MRWLCRRTATTHHRIADEFAALRAALRHEIKPNGTIEQIYLDDLAANVWEMQ